MVAQSVLILIANKHEIFCAVEKKSGTKVANATKNITYMNWRVEDGVSQELDIQRRQTLHAFIASVSAEWYADYCLAATNGSMIEGKAGASCYISHVDIRFSAILPESITMLQSF